MLEQDFAALGLDFGLHRRADAGIIGNAFLRHMDARHARRMRLKLADACLVQPTQTSQPISLATLEQLLQPGDFFLGDRHHDLPTNLVVHPIAPAKRHHLPDARHRQLRFQRPRLVVQARMQHAAIVAGLVLRHRRFLLVNPHPRVRIQSLVFVGRCQTHNPAANNGQILRCAQAMPGPGN